MCRKEYQRVFDPVYRRQVLEEWVTAVSLAAAHWQHMRLRKLRVPLQYANLTLWLSPNIVLNLIRRTLLLDELAPLPVGSEGSIVGSNVNIDRAETDFATATCDAANDRSGSNSEILAGSRCRPLCP